MNDWQVGQRVTICYPREWVNMPTPRVGRIVRLVPGGFEMVSQPGGHLNLIKLDEHTREGVTVRGWEQGDGWPLPRDRDTKGGKGRR